MKTQNVLFQPSNKEELNVLKAIRVPNFVKTTS